MVNFKTCFKILQLFSRREHVVKEVLLACDKIAPCKSAFRRLRLFIVRAKKQEFEMEDFAATVVT